MKSKKLFVTISLVLFLSPACALAAKKIKVTSPAFKNGGKIPVMYALENPDLDGSVNKSIPLELKVDKKTAKKIITFAITIVDKHPIAKKWAHLMVVNIPGDVRSIPAGAFSSHIEVPWMGTMWMLDNSYGFPGYGGPNPPPGSGKHVYEITVYGLDTGGINFGDPDTEPKSEKALLKLFKDFQKLQDTPFIVAKGKLKGTFTIP